MQLYTKEEDAKFNAGKQKDKIYGIDIIIKSDNEGKLITVDRWGRY